MHGSLSPYSAGDASPWNGAMPFRWFSSALVSHSESTLIVIPGTVLNAAKSTVRLTFTEHWGGKPRGAWEARSSEEGGRPGCVPEGERL